MNSRSHKRRIKAATGRGIILMIFLLLSGCKLAILDPKGSIGVAEKSILIDCLAIMLAIVIPTIIAIFGFAWWFRASNKRPKYLSDWDFSGRIEMIVWSIPVMVVILVGGVAWIGAHALDPYKKLSSHNPTLEVQVVSLDWKWLFIYPAQGVASVNMLEIPSNTPIHFSLTSASVMSAFFIPQLGSMIYTMNGMMTQLNLIADTPETFYGLSSHYNGDGFSDMNFEVRAVPPKDFTAWAATAHQSGPRLDSGHYMALARQSSNIKPFTYSAVAPELFQNIISQKLPPAPGPQTIQRSGPAPRKEP